MGQDAQPDGDKVGRLKAAKPKPDASRKMKSLAVLAAGESDPGGAAPSLRRRRATRPSPRQRSGDGGRSELASAGSSSSHLELYAFYDPDETVDIGQENDYGRLIDTGRAAGIQCCGISLAGLFPQRRGR